MAEIAPKTIWTALRLDATQRDIPYCSECDERIQIGEIYCERTKDEPLVVCQTCTTEMLDARLKLIAQGG